MEPAEIRRCRVFFLRPADPDHGVLGLRHAYLILAFAVEELGGSVAVIFALNSDTQLPNPSQVLVQGPPDEALRRARKLLEALEVNANMSIQSDCPEV